MNTEPLARACRWVDANLTKFAIVAEPAAVMPTLKAVTEVFHAGDYLARTEAATWKPIGERWKAFAWQQIRGGGLIRDMLATTPRNLPVVAAFVPFHLAGHVDPTVAPLVTKQLSGQIIAPLIWTIIGPALRILGIPWQATGARVGGKPISMLAWRVAPEIMPQDAVYLLAHECMYATSWGDAPSPLDVETAEYVAAALPVLAERHAHDADVVAELIIAMHALYLPCAAPAAWQVLERAQTRAGNVEGPPPHSMFRRFPHPCLERTYHTTLAAIMAWSGCLRPGAHREHRRGVFTRA